MHTSWKYICVGTVALGLAALVVGVFLWWSGRATTLDFRDRAFPEGFREVVIESSISRFDPIAGLQPALPGVPQGERSKRSIRAICDALFRDPGTPAVGNPSSSIQIAAFFDYRCPYCRTLTDILSSVRRDNLRMVYKEWPVLGAASELAARAALAADKQGHYLAFHRRLMSSRFIPTPALIEDLAGELGMNRSRLRDDMAASDVATAIGRNVLLASELGLSGTPVLVVGRTIVEGAITHPQLERLIRDVAASGPAASC